MDHSTHILNAKPPTRPEPEPGRSLTLRIPKPNWQVTALILIAVIAGFQTIQLVRLKGSVTAKAAASSTTASTATPSSGSSDLQAQVGGC
ncbi:MAG: hypothetical protein HY420_01670 [Candidatus Kerfeldbacteria bacterium]|nr:hypothetical protein [Candidatus Kerfeldbacteria bacterium]